jgi:hypothetical protein
MKLSQKGVFVHPKKQFSVFEFIGINKNSKIVRFSLAIIKSLSSQNRNTPTNSKYQ